MNKFLLLALFLTLPTLAVVPQGEPQGTWQSPSGKIVAVAYAATEDSPRKIYLRNASGEPTWSHLCDYERSAQVVFSPDEQWIAVNDYLASNIAEIRLYKRGSGLTFTDSRQNPSGRAWALLRMTSSTPYPNQLDHFYSEVLRWSGDSSAIMIRLWGHADVTHHVDDWYCVYSVATQVASTNISVMNQHAVVYKHEKNSTP